MLGLVLGLVFDVIAVPKQRNVNFHVSCSGQSNVSVAYWRFSKDNCVILSEIFLGNGAQFDVASALDGKHGGGWQRQK